MIITRSPLRISLGGGGTDLPSYYREHEGFLIAAAIDKYVYVNVIKPFTEGVYLKYSELEHVQEFSQIKHQIFRESLIMLGIKPQIEITTVADIPAGTGLGSSGSFTTGLLKALYAYERRHIHQEELANMACRIEIEMLDQPIGKQDQYAAAMGGVNCFTFRKDDSVETVPLSINSETTFDLEDNLLLFFTGYSRSANVVLGEQNDLTQRSDSDMLSNLNFVKDIGYQSRHALESGDTKLFGELMHEHWQYKKKRSGVMSNAEIDDYYEVGIKNGAIGGKLVGAGGGGFLMFMANDRSKLRNAMTSIGLEEVRFKFDYDGTKVVGS